MENADATLDGRFESLRHAVDREIAHAKRTQAQEFARLLERVGAAQGAEAWCLVWDEASATFAGEPAALEFLRALQSALTPLAPKAASETDQQERQLRARRFARVKVAELQLYQAAEVRAGRATGDLYGSLQSQIDLAREAFRERFLTEEGVGADYLHAELVRALANDDAAMLGPGYPGPLA